MTSSAFRYSCLAAFFCSFLCSGCQSLYESPVDSKCRELGEERAQEIKKNSPSDYVLLKRKTFFSKALSTCVQTEEPEASTETVEFNIDDLSRSFLKDGTLMHCDKDGADSAIISKVRAFDGYVSNVPYKDWLDDGFGGSPRTLKTPVRPYTKSDCQKVFNKWTSTLLK